MQHLLEANPAMAGRWQHLIETHPLPDLVALSVHADGSVAVDIMLAELGWARTAREFWDEEASRGEYDDQTRWYLRRCAGHYRAMCLDFRRAIAMFLASGEVARLEMSRCQEQSHGYGSNTGTCSRPRPCLDHETVDWELDRIAEELGVPRRVLQSGPTAATHWAWLNAHERATLEEALVRLAAGDFDNANVKVSVAATELSLFLRGQTRSYGPLDWTHRAAR